MHPSQQTRDIQPMLSQCWANIETTLVEYLVFAGMLPWKVKNELTFPSKPNVTKLRHVIGQDDQNTNAFVERYVGPYSKNANDPDFNTCDWSRCDWSYT